MTLERLGYIQAWFTIIAVLMGLLVLLTLLMRRVRGERGPLGPMMGLLVLAYVVLGSATMLILGVLQFVAGAGGSALLGVVLGLGGFVLLARALWQGRRG